MRNDLTKVLCEQPRSQSHRTYGEYRHDRRFKYDEKLDQTQDAGELNIGLVGGGFTRESMKFRGHDKSFGEHLSPLEGIVRKSVGRKWDDVYSEICKAFDRRSATGTHIFQHLFDYIETKAYYGKDGTLMVFDRYFGERKLVPEEGSWRGSEIFYVDPDTGIVKQAKEGISRGQYYRELKARLAARAYAIERKVDENTTLKWEKGVWYEIKTEKRRYIKHVGIHWDGVRELISWSTPRPGSPVTAREVGTEIRVQVHKKTLSTKEKKRYNLI